MALRASDEFIQACLTSDNLGLIHACTLGILKVAAKREYPPAVTAALVANAQHCLRSFIEKEGDDIYQGLTGLPGLEISLTILGSHGEIEDMKLTSEALHRHLEVSFDEPGPAHLAIERQALKAIADIHDRNGA